MTNQARTPMDEVSVTQADRELYACLFEIRGFTDWAAEIRTGKLDGNVGILQVARHRLAAEQSARAEMEREIAELREALGAYIQADAYAETWPDELENVDYLAQQETHWRLTAKAWLSEELHDQCAEAAKQRMVAEDGGAEAIFKGTNTPAGRLRDLEACERAIERMGWSEIKAFNAELAKGQDVREDAGGYFLRAIAALFGIKPKRDEVTTHQDAARALIAKAQPGEG